MSARVTRKVWGLWWGGASYAAGYVADDTEEFRSIREALEETARRASGTDSHYPMVRDSEMHVFLSDPRNSDDPYPDRIIRQGPRGGWRVESC